MRNANPGAGPAHVVDKGIPTAGLLARVMVAKFADHLALYSREKIFSRAGMELDVEQLQALVLGLRTAMRRLWRLDHTALTTAMPICLSPQIAYSGKIGPKTLPSQSLSSDH